MSAEAAKREPLNIKLGPGITDCEIRIGEKDITRNVTALHLDLEAGEVAKATVNLIVTDAVVELEECDTELIPRVLLTRKRDRAAFDITTLNDKTRTYLDPPPSP